MILNSRLVSIVLIQSRLINNTQKKLVIGVNDQTISKLVFDDSVNGIIDFDINKIGQKINGIKIQNFKKIDKIISKFNINKIVLSYRDLNHKDKIFSVIQKYNIAVELINENNEISKLNDSYLDEVLFSTKKIKWNNDSLSLFIKDKTILITGAGGSIGSQIVLNIVKYRPKLLILIDNSEYNLYNLTKSNELNTIDKADIIYILQSVTNKDKVDKIFIKYKPDIVFHAAAYKHVNILEFNELEAVNTNIFGTLNIVQSCINNNVKNFTLISTDKAVNPSNFMGETKKVCEFIVQSFYNHFLKTNMSIVRFGNVINSNGSVLPLFKKQIQDLGPVTVTDNEVTRYFMTIKEASKLVLETTIISKGGEIFALNMGHPIKILDIAKKMINFSGYNYLIDQKYSNKLKIKNLIKINFTGLRKGEKLHEEIFYGNDQEKTNNKEINKSIEPSLHYDEVRRTIKDLQLAYKNNDVKNTRFIIKKSISKINSNEKN